MTDIAFPVFADDDPTAEGVVATWFVENGDQVEEGDLLAEVAVDKVNVEVVAPHAGTVTVLVPPDVAVAPNTTIATVS